jgi:hypothetical protein
VKDVTAAYTGELAYASVLSQADRSRDRLHWRLYDDRDPRDRASHGVRSMNERTDGYPSDIFGMPGTTGPTFAVAVIGAVLVVVLYHAVRRRA